MASSSGNPNPDAAWVHRYRALRFKLALAVAALALIFGAVMLLKDKLLTIDPGKGTPIGWSVRTNDHIATLIQTLEAYTPSPNRDHSKDTYAVSLFIVPLDGSKPQLVPISSGHGGNTLGLARVLGGDGFTIWYNVNGVGGVDLKDFEPLTGAALKDAPPSNLQGALPHPLAPRIGASLAAGFFVNDREWLGLLSAEEAGGAYAPGKWLRPITHAEEGKVMRRFHRGTVGDDSGHGSRRIEAMASIGDAEYLNAAFLRMAEDSLPLRPRDPDGALMLHTSAPGLKGTALVSRVSVDGRILWQTDTGIDRFTLSQILPGQRSVAFVGTRPPVSGKVSEPLLLIVDNGTGAATTHSLWR